MRQSSADLPNRSDTPFEAADRPPSRRRLLRRLALAAAPLATLLAGACDKPYYDRDRGVLVWRRPRK